MTPIQATDVEPGDMLYAGPKPGATQFVGKVEVVWRDPRALGVKLPGDLVDVKRCNSCGRLLPAEHFRLRGMGQRQALSSDCLACIEKRDFTDDGDYLGANWREAERYLKWFLGDGKR